LEIENKSLILQLEARGTPRKNPDQKLNNQTDPTVYSTNFNKVPSTLQNNQEFFNKTVTETQLVSGSPIPSAVCPRDTSKQQLEAIYLRSAIARRLESTQALITGLKNSESVQ
jgi:hypothetical protein